MDRRSPKRRRSTKSRAKSDKKQFCSFYEFAQFYVPKYLNLPPVESIGEYCPHYYDKQIVKQIEPHIYEILDILTEYLMKPETDYWLKIQDIQEFIFRQYGVGYEGQDLTTRQKSFNESLLSGIRTLLSELKVNLIKKRVLISSHNPRSNKYGLYIALSSSMPESTARNLTKEFSSRYSIYGGGRR
jgi:hypothetical protein